MAKKKTTKKAPEEVNPLDALDTDVDTFGDVIDFDNVDDTFKPIPPGKYRATVTEVSTEPSKAGNPMITLVLTVDTGDGKTRKVWDHYVLNSPVGLSRLKNLVKMLAPDAYNSFKVSKAPEYFTGKVVNVTLKVEAGQEGRQNNRVTRIEPWDEVEELF